MSGPLENYKNYHQNKINILIHQTCIPLLLMSFYACIPYYLSIFVNLFYCLNFLLFDLFSKRSKGSLIYMNFIYFGHVFLKENFSKSASETYNRYQDLATEKYHKGKEVVVEGYDQNPLLACGLAFGAGLVFGAMFPVAKREQELLRESATRLRDSLDDQTAHFVNQTTDAVEDVTEKVKGHENIPDKGIDGQLPH